MARYNKETLHAIEDAQERSLHQLLEAVGGMAAFKVEQNNYVFRDDLDAPVGYLTGFIDNTGRNTQGDVELVFHVHPAYRHAFLGSNRRKITFNISSRAPADVLSREQAFAAFVSEIKQAAEID